MKVIYALICSVICLSFNSSLAQESKAQVSIIDLDSISGIQEVSAKEFRELSLQENIQLVDVRTAEEFSSGHIKGSILLNVQAEDFMNKIQALDKSKPVLVYCRSGKRSMDAARKLEMAGFKQTISLKGGIIAWEKQKLPIQK